MSTHNICFHGEIRKIFTGYPPLSRPMNCVLLLSFQILVRSHFAQPKVLGLIRVYTVCHLSSYFKTYEQVVKWTCSDSKHGNELSLKALIKFAADGKLKLLSLQKKKKKVMGIL